MTNENKEIKNCPYCNSSEVKRIPFSKTVHRCNKCKRVFEFETKPVIKQEIKQETTKPIVEQKPDLEFPKPYLEEIKEELKPIKQQANEETVDATELIKAFVAYVDIKDRMDLFSEEYIVMEKELQQRYITLKKELQIILKSKEDDKVGAGTAKQD